MFIRDDAEALMQYGCFECPDLAYEARRISQHEEDEAMIELDIQENALTEEEIAADCYRRQKDQDAYYEALSIFLADWSGL